MSSAEIFRRALLDANSIARPDRAVGGSSGGHIVKVLERLGIAEQVDAKSVWAGRPGEVVATPGHAVAEGWAEISLHQVQELLAVPGLEMVRPCPAELQGTVVFCAGVMTGARNAEGARALIDFVRTQDARAVIKAKGMEPAGP